MIRLAPDHPGCLPKTLDRKRIANLRGQIGRVAQHMLLNGFAARNLAPVTPVT
ncbi:MAG: hypothetical protein IPN92_17935 [Chromatiaceae bacterium]|nr:hypothetical protein [Chromatiaceae bacterium]